MGGVAPMKWLSNAGLVKYRIGGMRGKRSMPVNDIPFSIDEHFMAFVDSQVREGRYSNASEVLRAALRLLEEQEDKQTALRTALIEGEESGQSVPFDFEAFIARKRDQESRHE